LVNKPISAFSTQAISAADAPSTMAMVPIQSTRRSSGLNCRGMCAAAMLSSSEGANGNAAREWVPETLSGMAV
jgi:hypothetical protein